MVPAATSESEPKQAHRSPHQNEDPDHDHPTGKTHLAWEVHPSPNADARTSAGTVHPSTPYGRGHSTQPGARGPGGGHPARPGTGFRSPTASNAPDRTEMSPTTSNVPTRGKWSHGQEIPTGPATSAATPPGPAPSCAGTGNRPDITTFLYSADSNRRHGQFSSLHFPTTHHPDRATAPPHPDNTPGTSQPLRRAASPHE